MSKKPYSTKNTLDTQKSRIKHIFVDYLSVALLFLLMSIVVLIVALTLEDKAHANRILYIVIPILSVFCAVFLFFSLKRFFLYHAFKRARLDKEYTIKIDCKSIRFITYTRVRHIADVIGIIFVDTNSQKYIYVLPNELIDSKIARAEVRQECVGKTIEFICYNDTKLIKYCDVLSQLSNNI